MDLSEIREASGHRHPWEIARVRALRAILRRHPKPVESILDIGCGDGFVGASLRSTLGARALVGVDVHLPESACGVSLAADHVVERHRSDRAIGDRRFDLVLALDVIEHVADDRALLRDIVRPRLKPGGLLLVTVPAFQSLFSDHDRALRHFRRYSGSQLRATLAASGLDILEDGYFFGSLLAPRALATVRERVGRHKTEHGAGSWRGPRWLSSLLVTLLTVDAEVSIAARRFGIRIPGLTAWILCSAR